MNILLWWQWYSGNIMLVELTWHTFIFFHDGRQKALPLLPPHHTHRCHHYHSSRRSKAVVWHGSIIGFPEISDTQREKREGRKRRVLLCKSNHHLILYSSWLPLRFYLSLVSLAGQKINAVRTFHSFPVSSSTISTYHIYIHFDVYKVTWCFCSAPAAARCSLWLAWRGMETKRVRVERKEGT